MIASLLLATLLAAPPALQEGVRPPQLARVFGDGMVLQRERHVAVWGTGVPMRDLVVEFGDQRVEHNVDHDGHFLLSLDPMPASSEPRTLRILQEGSAPLEIEDVLVGDVWICSGQSNMDWELARCEGGEEAIASSHDDGLRLLNFSSRLYPGSEIFEVEVLRGIGRDDLFETDGWRRSAPESAAAFSGVGWFFGRELRRELDVPIGLIQNAVGGSPIEAWLRVEDLEKLASWRVPHDTWLDHPGLPAWCRERARHNLSGWIEAGEEGLPHHPFEPGYLRTSGARPFIPFAKRGVLWYQGESNATAGGAGTPALDVADYASKLELLIEDWRLFDLEEPLPFYFVQLPGLNRDWAAFREMQLELARRVPETGVAITIDVGHPTDVHPRDKRPVGERLARLALAGTYGRERVPTGPLFASHEVEGSTVWLEFEHVGRGLVASDRQRLRGFEVAGADRHFHAASAEIVGERVALWSGDVLEPVAARYGWADDPDVNLANREGLPAAPLRTDRWDDVGPAQPAHVEGFEGAPVGPLEDFEGPLGSWQGRAGQAEISDRFAHSGERSLHLRGGEERTLTFTLANTLDAPHELEFRAERWTRREPFAFRIEARAEGRWSELFDGSATLRVGARFLSHVRVELPAGTRALRLSASSPEGTGVLIDDWSLRPVRPMRLTRVNPVQPLAPALVGRARNPVLDVRLVAEGGLDPLGLRRVVISTDGTTDLADVEEVRLYYSSVLDGLEAAAPFGEAQAPAARMVFEGEQRLFPGVTHLWVSYRLSADADLEHRVAAACLEVELVDGTRLAPALTAPAGSQRIGVALRTAGQDDCHTYRIPGLATTNAGTLIAVYDNRYRGSGDLPGDIDVGMSRSTDGGRSWQPMRVVLDMGDEERWRFDGVGDPAVLVDRATGTVWVAGSWAHGALGWNGSRPGLAPDQTQQLVLTRSDDDGLSWSAPMHLTAQLKDPRWRLFLLGPGKGISLRDGTLVFAAQYRAADGEPHQGKPFSTLISSADHGVTWRVGSGVKIDTTEAQLVELADGRLMINCRDNRGGARSVYTTRDLGRTWDLHASSRGALSEPVCMASLMRVEHELHGDLLLFSNPASTAGRFDMTLRVSADAGRTWPERWHTLYDERPGYGYSCLTRIDEEHVGVLYEGVRELYFLRFSVDELVAGR